MCSAAADAGLDCTIGVNLDPIASIFCISAKSLSAIAAATPSCSV